MKIERNTLQLYLVTDRRWIGENTLTEQVEWAIKGGVSCVQLREKTLSFDAFLSEAKKIKHICDKYHVPLIINDNVEIALKVKATGIHIGQTDEALMNVRKQAGHKMIIGVSVQTLEEAIIAEQNGADYLGVGAMFHTTTKTDAKLVDFATLQEICQAVTIPVVAIGGITKDDMQELAQSGIDGVAVISAILAETNIVKATSGLKEKTKVIVGGKVNEDSTDNSRK